MYNIYITNLDQKIEKVLNIFKSKLPEVRIITSNMTFVGLQYRQYRIKDYALLEAERLLGMHNTPCYTLGGLAKHWLNAQKRTRILSLHAAEEVILRSHYYANRVEVFKLIGTQPRNTKLISLDFNQMYLNLLKHKLPITRLSLAPAASVNPTQPGFYFIKYRAPVGCEPILPSKYDNLTYFRAGVGQGIYWHEEILYFLAMGGVILDLEAIVLVDQGCAVFEPFINRLSELPNRKIRKGLANQLFGHLGMQPWKYKKEVRLGLPLAGDTTVRRLRQLGDFTLIETGALEAIKNPFSSLAWSLIITARARILLHKLIQDAQRHGLVVYFINLDELVVEETEALEKLKKTWGRQIKINILDEAREQQLGGLQVNFIHRRRRSGAESATYVAWGAE